MTTATDPLWRVPHLLAGHPPRILGKQTQGGRSSRVVLPRHPASRGRRLSIRVHGARVSDSSFAWKPVGCPINGSSAGEGGDGVDSGWPPVLVDDASRLRQGALDGRRSHKRCRPSGGLHRTSALRSCGPRELHRRGGSTLLSCVCFVKRWGHTASRRRHGYSSIVDAGSSPRACTVPPHPHRCERDVCARLRLGTATLLGVLSRPRALSSAGGTRGGGRSNTCRRTLRMRIRGATRCAIGLVACRIYSWPTASGRTGASLRRTASSGVPPLAGGDLGVTRNAGRTGCDADRHQRYSARGPSAEGGGDPRRASCGGARSVAAGCKFLQGTAHAGCEPRASGAVVPPGVPQPVQHLR